MKAAATVRNQTVTYGGVTPLELAFGRRPADLIQLDVATPTQLTIDRNEEEMTAIQIKQLSKQAFQEARQSEDIRRDLAQNLRMSSKPLQVKDEVFYWQEDKSKIRSDGSKGGGFDVMTSRGRRMVMEIIREQAPDVILMAPVCGPWSNMQNIREKRRRYLPMVARYQLKHRRYFIIENPQTSRIWYLTCMQQLFSDPSVTWQDFHFCAYGLKDPESGLRSLKPTSLMHCLPSEVMRPIFRRCV